MVPRHVSNQLLLLVEKSRDHFSFLIITRIYISDRYSRYDLRTRSGLFIMEARSKSKIERKIVTNASTAADTFVHDISNNY